MDTLGVGVGAYMHAELTLEMREESDMIPHCARD
jgi:hypothetical protein